MEPLTSGDDGRDCSCAKRKLKRAINKIGQMPVKRQLAYCEVCSPRLDRKQERHARPYQSRGIQLHFGPGQYEAAVAKQDLRDCEA